MRYFQILLIVVFAIAGCKKSPTDSEMKNSKPQAFLWIFPNNPDSLALGISKQHIHWWGEDKDGYVVGFLVGIGKSETSVEWIFKIRNDSVISFPLLTVQDTFLVFVKAIDNHFREKINDGTNIALAASHPFIDYENDGVFNNNDRTLPTLQNALGATAKQKFPIKNTPPTVKFEINSSNVTVQPSETSFTVVTFAWRGNDNDGDNTITKYEIALNDTATNNWVSIDSTVNMITLFVPRAVSDIATGSVTADVMKGTYGNTRKIGEAHGLRLNDTNRIFLRVKDIAEDYSPIVSLPDSGFLWYVKKPKSKLLVIEDYVASSGPNSPDSVLLFYKNIFSQLADSIGDSVRVFDFLSLRRNDGAFIPFHLDPALILTLQQFNFVFWYAGQEPSWSVASNPLFQYAVDPATNGKVLFSTAFQFSIADPRGSIVSFAPIEAVSLSDDSTATRAYADTTVSNISTILNFPPLQFKQNPSIHSLFFYRNLYPRSTATPIYKIDSIVSKTHRKFSPTVGVIDANNRFVFMGVPLHLLNGNGNLPSFFNTVFGNIFK